MFRRTALTLTAAAALLTGAWAPTPVAGPAAAKKPSAGANDSDLKCMLIASALSQNQDPKARNLSGLMAFYYLGRLDAKSPGINLAVALKTEAQGLKNTDMQVEGQRCVATMNGRMQALQTLGGGGGAPPAGAAPKAPAAPPVPQ